jgi:peptidyl-prolyl cis-trans isomerase C
MLTCVTHHPELQGHRRVHQPIIALAAPFAVDKLRCVRVTIRLLSHQGVYRMVKASARHILVDSEQQCLSLKEQIGQGADFADLAKQFSSCPSGKEGGELGEFGPGMMVREFDEVVFSAELNAVQGPVKTQFGYHLLEVTSRSG